MTRLIAMFAVLGLAVASPARAAFDLLASLQARDFATLERELGAVETRFEKGALDEYALLDAFRPLYMREDRVSADLDAWVQAYPKSYVALLARGTYYRKLGELNRGTGYAASVPDGALSYMDSAFARAEKDLVASLPLTPKPYLAVLNLMNIARYRSNLEAADTYLNQGNALLAGNMLLRGRYQDLLKPRWGGSYERMQAFVDRSRKEGIGDANVGLLRAMIVDDQALVQEESGDMPGAMQRFAEAVRLAQGASLRLQQDYIGNAVRACEAGVLQGVECPR